MATTQDAQGYLDPRTLAAIEPLQLRARMIVEGIRTGMHRSPHHGVSVEFAEHRPYAAGDDLRHLDWKVFGRSDKLYIKQYQQETNLDLLLLVDISGSMGYTSDTVEGWRKCDHALALAVAMAYLALQQGDRVGMTLFDHEVQAMVRPASNRTHWQSLVAAAQEHLPEANFTPPEEDHSTDLERVFGDTVVRVAQRSLIVLISDMLDHEATLEQGLARLRHRGHDALLLQTLDHAEWTFPFRSASEFIGLEGEEPLRLDPSALQKAYLQTLEDHQAQLAEATRKFGFDYLALDTSDHLAEPLSRLIARRAALIGKGN
ncbi:MAG: DUF58 domain-containing protein [Phycisphaeraceae bacterium]|nr:DUF58 domain-containing protein [Phycisphaeraceae bacterium]